MMKLSIVVCVLGVAALGSLAMLPANAVKSTHSSQALLPGAEIPPEVQSILERSCKDCHSDKTEWPWYSFVPPMSTMIESDVAHGRSQMNLSHWSEYSADDRQAMLTSLALVVQAGAMPPSKYTLLHPHAKLSAKESELIYNWARGERRRLKASPTERPGIGD